MASGLSQGTMYANRLAAVLASFLAISLSVLSPAVAQTAMGVAAADVPSPPASPSCVLAPDHARFDMPLPRLGRLLASGTPIKIVALGSSSTFGAGASSPGASYPSRLSDELARRFPGHEFTMLNRGVNGDEAGDMLARLETAVIAESPDLVLWQVGTNSVLRDNAVPPHAALLHEGLSRMKA